VAAAACLIAFLVLAPALARILLLAVALPALLALLGMLLGREKSLAGELVVAVAFAVASLPTAIAGHVELARALAVAQTWAVVFVLGILAARAVIDRYKTGRRLLPGLTAGLAMLAVLQAALSIGAPAPRNALSASGPLALLVLAALFGGVTPRRLRRLGWALVAGNVAALVILIALLR
jgi:hypothetical protein